MKTFPSYDQLYDILTKVADAITRKKADLVPNELTDEEVENIRNLFMPAESGTTMIVRGEVDYWSERYQYVSAYFDSDRSLYISRVEYSDEYIWDIQDVTTWHVWDLENESLHGGPRYLRLTISGDKDYISDSAIVNQFVTNFHSTVCPPQ